MNDPTPFAEEIERLFKPSPGGVVGLVEELLMFCRGRELRLDFHEGFCRVCLLGDDSRESVDVTLPKSVFRAVLARVASLCDEQNPDSVTPYRGEGELSIRSDPGAAFRVAFTNTAAEQRLELKSSIRPNVDTNPIRAGTKARPVVAIEVTLEVHPRGFPVLKLPIYLDNHSTTRCDPRVLEVMLPYFTEIFGNAASVSHKFGWDAGEAVDVARAKVAKLIGAEAKEVIFTSGATEANNLAIKGVLASLQKRGNHLITAGAEHRAVLDPMKRLGREGWDVTILKPDSTGMVSAEAIEAAITPKTVLVSIMAANNEVGTINPTREIGRLCHDRGIVFHTDATQAVGKIPIDVNEDRIDLLSLSAHKMYGPKGIGALYVRRRDPQVRLSPLFDGGGHERGMRSGTLAVPLIVGLGEAAVIAGEERDEEAAKILGLRERLHRGIADRVEEIHLNGHPERRLAGNLNLSFGFVDGEALMMAMRDVAVSSGSACSAAEPEPSHVLTAIGVEYEMARSSLRFGLGRFTTEEEIDFAIDAVSSAVARLRTQSAAWSGRSIGI